MKIVYMGTPEIAASVLKAVLEMQQAGADLQVTGVFTQPDKPVGRKQVMTPPPVKVLALEQGIPVFQPRRIKRPIPVEKLRALAPDLILVTAYGQILSQEILDIPPLGCINMHASLLPSYRGAAPIQWAIANGEKVTGVTAMQMDAGMDTGDILLQKEVEITPEETEETLYEKLSEAGSEVIRETLEKLLRGEKLPARKQEESLATYAPIIRKEDGIVDFTRSAASIDCKIRGFHVWPGASCLMEGKKLTLIAARPLPDEEGQKPAPGAILKEYAVGKKPRFLVQCGQGILEILTLQLQGKKAMAASDFLRGIRALPDQLTSSEE